MPLLSGHFSSTSLLLNVSFPDSRWGKDRPARQPGKTLLPLPGGGDPSNATLPPNVIVPVHVLSDMLFGIIEAAESKPIHEFPLLDGMKSLNVRVLFRCGHMGKFLTGFYLLKGLPNTAGDEPRAIVVADNDAYKTKTKI
jgi:hypothetical protein